jgi:hypothetical protein
MDSPKPLEYNPRVEFFPGVNERAFGTPFTFADFIEHARQHAANNREAIPPGSCGSRFEFTPPSQTTNGLLSSIPGPTALVQWKTRSGATLTYEVHVSTDPLQGPRWTVQKKPNSIDLDVTCAEIQMAPGARHSPNDYLADVNASAANGKFHRFVFSVGLASMFGNRPPPQGWDLYEYYTIPANESPQDYQYGIDPVTGSLEFVRGDPAKLIRQS